MKYTEDIKKFIKKVLIFFIPIILLMGFLEFFGVYSGEADKLEMVIKLQLNNQNQYLFGRGVLDQELRPYKFKFILEKNPSIIVLGSSRVMQFRKEFFDDKDNFYNAGGIIHNIGDLLNFIELVPENKTPRTIIVGLDHYWFGDKREVNYGLSMDLKATQATYQWKSHIYLCRYILFNGIKNPVLLKDILKRQDSFSNKINIGLQALYGNGFRSDGSYQYGKYVTELRNDNKFIDRESPPMIERAKKGDSMFAFSMFSDERLEIFKKFLDLAEKRNIKIILISMPYSTDVYNELTTSNNHKQFFEDYRKNIKNLALERNIPYFDYSDLKSLKLSDIYMFDGVHITETGAATIIYNVLNDKGVKNIILNSEKLKNDLNIYLKDVKTSSFEINFNKN